MSCCFPPTAVKRTLKTKSVSEEKIHKEGSIYGEEMVDPISVVGGFCSMGPTPAALPRFLLPFPGLSQPGLFSAMSILLCFPSPGSAREISLHNRQHGKEQTFLCFESVPSASLW